jgi:hypothetical protein
VNAIAQTIRAAQDTEAAKKAAEAAAIEMQKELYADARARVDKLIKDFNRMPMELQKSPTMIPMRNPTETGDEYKLLGKGLRFYLMWAKDGRSLCLMLNAVCRYALELYRMDGSDPMKRQLGEYQKSTEFMSLELAQRAIEHAGHIGKDSYDFRTMGHIAIDGRFVIGPAPYDEKQINHEFLCKTPVEWMTKIVGGPSIAPFVVLKTKGKK